MGSLTATAAKAVAGAASAAKSSGVSSASKSAASAKSAGSPKQVTPKAPSTTKSTGAVSKASTSAKSAAADAAFNDAAKVNSSAAKKTGAAASNSPTTKVVQTIPVTPSYTEMTPPTAADTRVEQSRPEGGLNSDAFYQRVADNSGIVPFEGVVDWAGIQQRLGEMANPGPVDITVRGGNTDPALYDKVDPETGLSFGMMLDFLNTSSNMMAPPTTTIGGRLPSEPVRSGSLPPYTPDDAYVGRTIDPSGDYSAPLGAIEAADVGSLPASERWGWGSPFFDMGSTIRTAVGDDPYMPQAPVDLGIDGAAAEPRAWDTVVDNTGKLLSNTALGKTVSTLFPDMWGGIGDVFKGIGSGGPVKDMPNWDADRGTWKSNDGSSSALPNNATNPSSVPKGTFSDEHGTYTSPPPFPDLNHNGVDDRKEGYTGPDTRPKPGTTPPPTHSDPIPLPVFDLPPTRTAQFPVMPPYDPGRSPEFMYFLNNHLADGGMVSAPAYAEGGAIDPSDPKVQLIGATEDVLEKIKGGAKPDEADAKVLKAFVAQFGDGALKSLNDNVGEGLSMKGAGKGRQIKGPGGPKDDAVPAVIVEEGTVKSPAKLSNNEFVMPVSAVEGLGEGDIKLGAERMQQLAERLSQKGAA